MGGWDHRVVLKEAYFSSLGNQGSWEADFTATTTRPPEWTQMEIINN